jgi:Asp-tRNA(Asn)/Glu-tRNA(Gln) amidotransferase B subunit
MALPVLAEQQPMITQVKQTLGIQARDAPDIRPDNPAFFYIQYPAGYQIELPDTGTGYPAYVKLVQ